MNNDPDNATELTQISLDIDDPGSGVPCVKLKSKLRKVPDWALNDLPDSTYEKVKFWTLVLSGVVLIRVVLFIVFLLLGGLCGLVAAIGVDPDPQKPWPRWRTWVATPIMFFSRCLLFCAGFHWIEIGENGRGAVCLDINAALFSRFSPSSTLSPTSQMIARKRRGRWWSSRPTLG